MVLVLVLLQRHLHARRVVVKALLLGRQAVVLDVREAIPVTAEHVVALLFLLERVSRLEAHELVQVEEHVEQHPADRLLACKVLEGDGQRVLGTDHVQHLAQHVPEIHALLSL